MTQYDRINVNTNASLQGIGCVRMQQGWARDCLRIKIIKVAQRELFDP